MIAPSWEQGFHQQGIMVARAVARLVDVASGVARAPLARGGGQGSTSQGVARAPPARGGGQGSTSQGVARAPPARGVARAPPARGVARLVDVATLLKQRGHWALEKPPTNFQIVMWVKLSAGRTIKNFYGHDLQYGHQVCWDICHKFWAGHTDNG
jgi:hypothetical protein